MAHTFASLLFGIPTSGEAWILWMEKWGPILLLLSFLGLCILVVRWYMEREPVRTIQVLGYDPRLPYYELREIELEGKYAVWEDPEGDNIRFIPEEETQHGSAEGPGWLLDLTDGRTMKINDSGKEIRTTGQELDKAVKDETIRQSLSTKQDKMAIYMKILLVAAPVIILFLIVIAIGVFTG